MSKNKVFIVIPSYNEERHIEGFLKEVVLTKLPVVFVDDGSEDNTYKFARKYVKEVLRHKVNLGKGSALISGCELAFSKGATAVILMDSDGQHNVGDLPKFLAALDKGYDVVFGSRNLNFGVPLVRFLGNKAASVLISLLFGIYVSDILCGYRALTKKAYDKIRWDSGGYGAESEMVVNTAKTRLKYCEVPVETIYLDGVKGVTVLDAVGIMANIIRWRITK